MYLFSYRGNNSQIPDTTLSNFFLNTSSICRHFLSSMKMSVLMRRLEICNQIVTSWLTKMVEAVTTSFLNTRIMTAKCILLLKSPTYTL